MFAKAHVSTAILLLLLSAPIAVAQEAAPSPPRAWTNSLGAGFALTSGNSDTSNLNVSFGTVFDPKSDHTFKASALYLRGDSEGTTRVDKMTGNARYETQHDRGFWFGELSYLRDPLKGIESLISPVAGFGLNVIKTDEHSLSIDAGTGAAFENSRELGHESSVAVKAGETFEWVISPTSRFTQRLNGLWKADDPSDAHYHFEAGIVTAIAARAELKVSHVYDYKNQPAPEFEKGDSALFAAFVYKF